MIVFPTRPIYSSSSPLLVGTRRRAFKILMGDFRPRFTFKGFDVYRLFRIGPLLPMASDMRQNSNLQVTWLMSNITVKRRRDRPILSNIPMGHLRRQGIINRHTQNRLPFFRPRFTRHVTLRIRHHSSIQFSHYLALIAWNVADKKRAG